jgi:G:T-mismatch repair DNA endonuclease (very short patch repair protein)
LERLRLFALDATDIALSKLERNAERDREDVLRLAHAGYINREVLQRRYHEELRPYLLNKLSWHDKTLELWLEMAWPTP